jgi:hypothetical protein
MALELLQAGGEDVGAAAREVAVEVRVAERAMLDELPDDEEGPALTDDVERVRDRAVLVVRLHDPRIVAPVLVGWKS